MKRPELKKKRYSSVSVRAAASAAVFISLFGTALLYFFTQLTAANLFFFGLCFLTGSFVIIYFTSARLIQGRLNKLYEIIINIKKREFEEYTSDYTSNNRDEIDLIINRSIRASDTISKELTRLNKIENYRKEFIGDISHELKTPIFAIQGFIETLLNGALHDDSVNEIFLKKAMRNVNRLIFLTNDLMEISKLETGELQSNIKDIYLRDVVLDVVESMQYKAQNEDIEIHVKNFDKNVQVLADRNQLKQILLNLIENGIKYNKPGGYVEIGISDYDNQTNKLLLYIKDTGIGIHKKELNRVTERFFRVDKSRSRDKGGTGLGLAIVKHIVEAHGEKLLIESIPGEGSTFSITLTRATHFLD